MSFDLKKAAEYYVVAWVKDWRLRVYLNAVAPGTVWAEAHTLYPWLPHDDGPFIVNTTVRRWTSEAMRSINDALWDAESVAAKMAIAKRIEAWTSDKVNSRSKERKWVRRAQRDYERARLSVKLDIERAARSSGTDWSVVK